ncbi:MAG: sensor histidine kinase [Bryobacteraceae bacterium]|jgi:signal transduction histidine kinase
MPEQPEKLPFEASAYLQTLIGRELFRGRELAVVELVKNAYDSGARNVSIRISTPTEKRPASFEVTDDGSGMDLAEIKRLFMFAGYSEKSSDTIGPEGRMPTGEKGIGRFASDRLGSSLQVETKTAGQTEGIVVPINWNLFNTRKKRFNQIEVPYYRRPLSFLQKEQSGTRLTITQLREPWDRASIEELRRSLAQLLNPFDPPKHFQIHFEVVDSEALSGQIQGTPVVEPDFDLRFTVKGGGVLERTLKHTPTSAEEKKSTSSGIEGAGKLVGLRGRLYYYVKHPKRAQVHGQPAGVFLFRDGFRIEPFGSGTADWLGIGEKRAKRAGHAHIVPSRLFGFISISRQEHEGLRDTTSREALPDTAESRALVHVLKSDILAFLEDEIRRGVAEPRWEESRTRKAAELQRVRFQALSAMSSAVAHELRQPLQVIRSAAGNIATRVRQLRLDDEVIRNAQQSIDLSIERIDQRIQLISALTGTKLDISSKIDMVTVIKEECQQFSERIQEHAIELQLNLPATQPATVSDPLVRMVVKNIVENAIKTLSEVGDGRRRRLQVSLQRENGRHVVAVQDNGLGIPADLQEKLFAKFAPGTTGGMGVALYVCQLLVKSHGGEIKFKTLEARGTTFTAYFAEQELPDAE